MTSDALESLGIVSHIKKKMLPVIVWGSETQSDWAICTDMVYGL